MYTKIACVILVAVVITHLIKDVDGCWGSSVPEICNSNLPNIPNMASRDPSIMITNASFYAIKCDLYMIRKYTWYRSEYKISNSCPRMFMCSTQFPIWMEGSHPEPYEGVVNRTGCLKSYEKCCEIRYSLAAVNCGDYMAYCLYGLPYGCHQRYCFDITKQSEDFSTQGSVRTTKHSKDSRKSSQTTLASNGVNTQYIKTTGVPNNPPYNPQAIESEDVSGDGLYKYYEADHMSFGQRVEDYKRPTNPAFFDIFRKTVLRGTTNIALKSRGSDVRISQQGSVSKDHIPPLQDEVAESNQGTEKEQPISDVNHNEDMIINQGQDAGGDEKLLTIIMIACMGVMFVTIMALLLVLVKHKRTPYEQITKSTTMTGQTKLEPLNIKGVRVINADNSVNIALEICRLMNQNSLLTEMKNMEKPKQIETEMYNPYHKILEVPEKTDKLTDEVDNEHCYETIS